MMWISFGFKLQGGHEGYWDVHHPLTGTLKELKRYYTHDLRDQGILNVYLKALVDRCVCPLASKSTPSDMGGVTSVMKYKMSQTHRSD